MELEIIAELYELASSGTDAKVLASIHAELKSLEPRSMQCKCFACLADAHSARTVR